MKVIDAIWEKRNLGITTQEIEINVDDSIEDLKKIINDCDYQYRVLKIPAGKTDCMFLAEEEGFQFIECSIHVTHDLKNMELTPILNRLDAQLSYDYMSKEDIEVLFDEIRNGLFTTDRVTLDTNFTQEQSSNRYIGWISDEISRGCEMYKLIYKDKAVGFFAFKETEEGVYYPFLAGMYFEYQKTGLGSLFNYKPMVEAKRRGGKRISTYISTNNSNALRMHAMYGFKFGETKYVYIKHNT